MSVYVSTAVWERSKSTGSDRLVMLALADFADQACRAWPSVGTLVGRTLLGERTVQQSLVALQALGELVVEYNAGPRGCNLYTLTIALTPAESAPPQDSHPAESAPPQILRGGVQITTPGGAELAPEPSENHQEPPPPPTPTAAAVIDLGIDTRALATQVRAARLVLDLPVGRWTDRRITAALVEAHAEGMPVADLAAAILEVAVDPETRVPGRLLVAGPWWDAAHVHNLDEARRIAVERRAACRCDNGWLNGDGDTVTRCPNCTPLRRKTGTP